MPFKNPAPKPPPLLFAAAFLAFWQLSIFCALAASRSAAPILIRQLSQLGEFSSMPNRSHATCGVFAATLELGGTHAVNDNKIIVAAINRMAHVSFFMAADPVNLLEITRATNITN